MRILFNGDGFCEVARLVDIAAALKRNVVGKELERDDAQRGLEDEVRVGHGQHVLPIWRRLPSVVSAITSAPRA